MELSIFLYHIANSLHFVTTVTSLGTFLSAASYVPWLLELLVSLNK